MVNCHSCDCEFPDYHALAMHISQSKTGHRSSKKWAAKFLMVNSLSPANRRDHKNGRTPLPENYKGNKASTLREVSGKTQYAKTICPKCNLVEAQALPVEHLAEPLAWRIDGKIVRLCTSCGRKE